MPSHARCRARRSCGGARSRPRWSGGGWLMNRHAPRSRPLPRNTATSFRERPPSSLPKILRLPSVRGKCRELQIRAPKKGPYKRALRERFERLAAAEREEAARKAAKAEGCPCFDRLSMRELKKHLALSLVPRFNRGKGGPTREIPIPCRTSASGCADNSPRREGGRMERGHPPALRATSPRSRGGKKQGWERNRARKDTGDARVFFLPQRGGGVARRAGRGVAAAFEAL